MSVCVCVAKGWEGGISLLGEPLISTLIIKYTYNEYLKILKYLMCQLLTSISSLLAILHDFTLVTFHINY